VGQEHDELIGHVILSDGWISLGRAGPSELIYRAKQHPFAFLPGLLPILLLYFVLLFLPMLLLGRYGFYGMVPGSVRVREPWTLGNIGRFFSEPFYMRILGDTMLTGVIVVLICIVLSYPIAYILARMRVGKGILFVLVLAPFLVSQVVKTYAWMVILSNQGFLNWLLLSTGLTQEPIQLLYNRTGMIVGMVHVLLPFMILTLESVIRQIHDEVLDAARSLGAPDHQVFMRIVLPLSLPGLAAGSLLVFSLAISIFTTPALMGGDRIQLMSNFIYKRAVSLLDWPLAAVSAWTLMLTGMLVIVLYLRIVMPSKPETGK
jgi:putative spermidine/putrescine transport system permease protein